MSLQTLIEVPLIDLPLIKELSPDGWYDISPIFEYYIKSSFCYPFKLIINNEIAGLGTGIILNKTAWLAHIIVKPEYRNQGLGKKIVDFLLDFLTKKDCETISLIATDLGYPIYKKVGFIEQSEYIFFENKDKNFNFKTSENIFSYIQADFQHIYELDKKISGENRINLLEESLENAFVYKKDGILDGFYLPKLGEGVIVADTYESGIELMKLRITNLSNNIKTVLPSENHIACNFLKEIGFTELRRAKRMFIGKEYKFLPNKLFNRIAGNLG